MIAAHISRRYARALLEIGNSAGTLDSLVADIDKIGQIYEGSSDFRASVDNPLVPIASKKAILTELCDRLAVSDTAKHTALLLGDRRRLRILPEIASMLRELADARKGVVRAEVTTAVPCRTATTCACRPKLEKMTGKKVVVDRKTDPALIAGVVTRIGDRILDGSLRTRLQSLKDALLPQA